MAPSRFNLLACITVTLAILAFCVADEDPGLAAFSLPVLALAWWTGRSGTPWNMPRLAANLLVLAAVLRAGLNVIGSSATGPVVSDLTEFLVLIQLVKLFDRAKPRDEAQLLTLSLFIVIGALLTSNTFLTGMLVLAYTPLLTASAMILQIRLGLTRLTLAGGDRARAEHAPAPQARRRARHFRRVVAGALAASFVLGLVAFMLTPRSLGEGALGELARSSVRERTVGFHDQVRLGQPGFLNPGDSTPVMDVLVRDRHGDNAGGHQLGNLYLRGVTKGSYDPDRKAWRADRGVDASEDLAGVFMGTRRYDLQDAERNPRLEYAQVITLRGGTRERDNYLFALLSPAGIQLDDRARVEFRPHDRTFRIVARDPGPLSYTVWSQPVLVTTPRPPPPAPPMFREGPIRALALELAGQRRVPSGPEERDLAQNRALASAIQNHLRTLDYTLELGAPRDGRDPIEWFLFEARRGHCEYFASAMVALCQSLDLNARLVLGFLAAEFNSATGQYLVRQSNAHAWVEVEIEPGRWATFDPSPPAEIDRLHRPALGLLGRLKRFYETLEFAWNHGVVSFDEQRRQNLLGARGRIAGRETAHGLLWRARGWMERVRTGSARQGDQATPGLLRHLPLAIAVLAGVAAILIGARGTRRPPRRRRAGPRGLAARPPWGARSRRGFYGRALGVLAGARLGKPPHRPPLAHAGVIAGTSPAAADHFSALTRLYYRARFGGTPLSGAEKAEARRLIAELRAATQRA